MELYKLYDLCKEYVDIVENSGDVAYTVFDIEMADNINDLLAIKGDIDSADGIDIIDSLNKIRSKIKKSFLKEVGESLIEYAETDFDDIISDFVKDMMNGNDDEDGDVGFSSLEDLFESLGD